MATVSPILLVESDDFSRLVRSPASGPILLFPGNSIESSRNDPFAVFLPKDLSAQPQTDQGYYYPKPSVPFEIGIRSSPPKDDG